MPLQDPTGLSGLPVDCLLPIATLPPAFRLSRSRVRQFDDAFKFYSLNILSVVLLVVPPNLMPVPLVHQGPLAPGTNPSSNANEPDFF